MLRLTRFVAFLLAAAAATWAVAPTSLGAEPRRIADEVSTAGRGAVAVLHYHPPGR